MRTPEIAIGLQTIDEAIIKFLRTKIKPVIVQDNKQIQVPVIYGSPERWKSAQKDGYLRDKNGKLMLPIIMIQRSNIKENILNSPVNKYQRYTFKTGWNARNGYDRFTALNRIIPSEKYTSTIIPDYYDIEYEAMIWTEYMPQINSLVENLSFESNEYWGDDNNYKFITRVKQFQQITELPATSDRMVRNKFKMDVRAYVLPKTALDRDGYRESTTKIKYSPKKVVFDTEIVLSVNPLTLETDI